MVHPQNSLMSGARPGCLTRQPAGRENRPPFIGGRSRTRMDSLGDGEDPDDAALRYVLLPTYQLAHQPLLKVRVDSPAGLHRHILHAVDLVGRRRRDDPGVGLEVPKLLAGLGIVGAELTVVGAAREEQA